MREVKLKPVFAGAKNEIMSQQEKQKIFGGASKTTIIGIAIAIVTLGGAIWFAYPSSQQANDMASLPQSFSKALSAEETDFDFGSISMAAGKVKHTFKIQNISNEPINIEKMYTSCMCTAAVLMMEGGRFGPYGMAGHGFIPKINEMLSSGEKAVVEVIFDPAAHGPAGVGRIQRTITIENSAGQPFELGFTALVTP